MRVLAVDPGLTRCGVGVVATGQGSTLQIVTVGVIRTSADLPLHERLHELRVELDAVFERTQPDAVAVERMFARHDVSTIMGTAQASAVPMLAAAERGLPLGLHTPSEVKAAVTGNGRADKAQVTTMVTRILGLEVAPRPADAADALALAICHHWRGGGLARRGASADGASAAPAAVAYRQAAAAAARRSRSASKTYRDALGAASQSAPATRPANRGVRP
ncbi:MULTISPECIES: crossover junction endodeoxyribonuclease RuvC [Dermacoccus]|uniref:crossover junction endodeoxyribonuclease RuvC n=1 Tax=Dermacoccus TaxID=57495 RepID=UPI0007803F9A|nr:MULTISPECIES: crossover junction endodeoxyribonuclease RuvC [Dermacoccus]MBO1757741.1 crossover junction endodeoxyribonuclease RuvC [Dermacoccus sp. NHGro5]MCT1604858.1 crossover junction endodeoxyribonuclease RuvC [Dermacoccus nishinomiyaensis]